MIAMYHSPLDCYQTMYFERARPSTSNKLILRVLACLPELGAWLLFHLISTAITIH
jgi:hypothetical protein